MPRKTYGAEEIVGILRDIEILNDKRKRIADCCRDKGIREAIYYRWKKENARLHPAQAKRLKELEKENGRLKNCLQK